MIFEAHYSRWRLARQGVSGLALLAAGAWAASRPANAFEDSSSQRIEGLANLFGLSTAVMGQAIGATLLALVLLILPVIARNWLHRGPAVRIDQSGVLFHPWSDKPVAWGNIAAVTPYVIRRHRMVGIELIDPARDIPRSILGRLGRANRALGFGDLSITLQGTDGDYDALCDVLAHYLVARG